MANGLFPHDANAGIPLTRAVSWPSGE